MVTLYRKTSKDDGIYSKVQPRGMGIGNMLKSPVKVCMVSVGLVLIGTLLFSGKEKERFLETFAATSSSLSSMPIVNEPEITLEKQQLLNMKVSAHDSLMSFSEECYMVETLDEDVFPTNFYDSEDGYDDDDDDDDDAEDSSDEEEDQDDDDYYADDHYPDYSIGRPDLLHLGRCRHDYPETFPPPAGYLNDIDFFFLRDNWLDRDRCFLYCIEQLPDKEVNIDMLVDAVRMGLSGVVRQLLDEYHLDHLALPSKGTQAYPRSGLNAVQEAIIGGHAEVLSILTNNNLDMIIDSYGRTVKDYLNMRGCPIRPKHARQYLNLDTTESQATVHQTLDHRYFGWNSTASAPADDRCDIDILDQGLTREVFYKDYWMTGRPFVLRNAVPEGELRLYSKERMSQTKYYNLETSVRVGAQGKPSLTGQKYCPVLSTIGEVENGATCPTMPGVPMFRSADVPDDDHYAELFPLYDGDPFHIKGGWRHLREWFGKNYQESDPDFYLFLGGDESGASFHWHNAAFNVLYVGLKQWRITPPRYKGITAVHSNAAQHLLPDDFVLRCTQGPGDFVYLPDYWGHLVVNAGFTMGTATLAVKPVERMIPPKAWTTRFWESLVRGNK